MSTARPSVTKRQREQQKRERKVKKAEKRAERKNTPGGGGAPIDYGPQPGMEGLDDLPEAGGEPAGE